MKNTIVLALILWCFGSYAQKAELKTYTFSKIEQLQKQNPKPILIFFYTDWCQICYGMKESTFKNQEVINTLNNNFYFISFNGEAKNDVTFLKKKFVHKPSGNKTGIHQLTKELASIDGRINYPTTVLLNSKYEINVQIDSYIDYNKMKKILDTYLKQNKH